MHPSNSTELQSVVFAGRIGPVIDSAAFRGAAAQIRMARGNRVKRVLRPVSRSFRGFWVTPTARGPLRRAALCACRRVDFLPPYSHVAGRPFARFFLTGSDATSKIVGLRLSNIWTTAAGRTRAKSAMGRVAVVEARPSRCCSNYGLFSTCVGSIVRQTFNQIVTGSRLITLTKDCLEWVAAASVEPPPAATTSSVAGARRRSRPHSSPLYPSSSIGMPFGARCCSPLDRRTALRRGLFSSPDAA